MCIRDSATITIGWTYFLPKWTYFKNLSPFLQEVTYPAAGMSVLMLVTVSLFTNPPKETSLEQFFNESN